MKTAEMVVSQAQWQDALDKWSRALNAAKLQDTFLLSEAVNLGCRYCDVILFNDGWHPTGSNALQALCMDNCPLFKNHICGWDREDSAVHRVIAAVDDYEAGEIEPKWGSVRRDCARVLAAIEKDGELHGYKG